MSEVKPVSASDSPEVELPPTSAVPPLPENELESGRSRLLALLRGRIDEQAPAIVVTFLNRLLAIKDRGMRARMVAERLGRYDAHLCLALLQAVVYRSVAREAPAREVLLDLCTARPIAGILGYYRTRQVYELAMAGGHVAVARLFLSSETMARRQLGKEQSTSENAKLPDESLGWRKKLARSRDRLKLDRLLFDRHPAVIRLLLRNPRLIERDVVRVAAMRPTNPDCLAEVFNSQRWIQRYHVKVALACNPYTPVDIALACVPHLMMPKLLYVAENKKVHSSVREVAAELLSRRRQHAPQDPYPTHLVSRSGAIVREVDGAPDFEIDLDQMARELINWRT